MNFFDRQEAARRQTGVLLVYYGLAVALIVCAFYLASRAIVGVTWGLSSENHVIRFGASAFRVFAWSGPWMLVTAGVSLAVILCATLYRRASLSGGGASVARSTGGREILPDATDFYERRLLNIVEEIALASGVPVPSVFVLDGEPGINAFAAGFGLRDAAVAVTKGALTRLSRDELQGVVAHEFSHILNGDMRLNSWLLGVLFGILVTSVLGRELMLSLRYFRVSSRGSKKGGGGAILVLILLSGLALWVIGSVGVFFARLIQASVSRQREFLADASAAQFTRNPVGLADALKRIGALSGANVLHCSNRAELSHFLFASSSSAWGFDALFATHPPLAERIYRLDPAFDGRFAAWEPPPPSSSSDPEPVLPPSLPSCACTPLARQVTDEAVGGAALSPNLREAATGTGSASALVYALLLSDDPEVRHRQDKRIAASESLPLAASAERIRESVSHESRSARRMAAELAIERLRYRDPAARAACVRLARELIEADGVCSLFEYLLLSRLVRTLTPGPVLGASACRPLPPRQAAPEASIVLAVLAYVGQPEQDAEAEQAWRSALSRATSFGIAGACPARSESTPDRLDPALERLNKLSPLLKRELLVACQTVVGADARQTDDEIELIRAIADRLDMPLPSL